MRARYEDCGAEQALKDGGMGPADTDFYLHFWRSFTERLGRTSVNIQGGRIKAAFKTLLTYDKHITLPAMHKTMLSLGTLNS